MNHTAAEDLDPAFALTEAASLALTFKAGNVHLRGRLRKRKMMGTELNLNILSCTAGNVTVIVIYNLINS
jgi:hypothetical protein